MQRVQGFAQRVKASLQVYAVGARIAMLERLQYPLASLMFMVNVLIEPIIYLVVWSSATAAQGGAVGGYTAGQFAGYYIIWTFVRQFNLAVGPDSFNWRIKNGSLAGELLRPIHPIDIDLGWNLGFKVMQVVYWIPIGVILWLMFKPEVNPQGWQLLSFPIVLMLAAYVRFFVMWLVGLICFWTERIDSLIELYFAAELLFSGRLVPLEIMPVWAQRVAGYLPFQWTFYFPIELLLGRVTMNEFWMGVLAQVAWILAAYVGIRLVWVRAVRRFTAVGA